jgi:hypothetical protein
MDQVARAEDRVRAGLSTEDHARAVALGRDADLQELLEAALREAAAAVAVGSTHDEAANT